MPTNTHATITVAAFPELSQSCRRIASAVHVKKESSSPPGWTKGARRTCCTHERPSCAEPEYASYDFPQLASVAARSV